MVIIMRSYCHNIETKLVFCRRQTFILVGSHISFSNQLVLLYVGEAIDIGSDRRTPNILTRADNIALFVNKQYV